MAHIARETWEALSPLLDELFDADEAQVQARLQQVRQADPALADRLAALLRERADVEKEAFLEGRAVDITAFGGAADPATLAGTTLGAYTIEAPLGQGGMGSVWLARRSDGRYEGKAAVKLLNLALLARGGAERFRREGSALARVAHPNIARLLDSGVTAAGQPYLILEHIDGQPIDRWCDDKRLPVRERLRLFLDVLRAVAHAHNNLILHLDVKPSNVLVTADGQVKLLDFGVSKLLGDVESLDPEATAAMPLTQLAGRAFTPEYAAPEQAQNGEVTTATDVYALGVMLYRLLAGAHPTTHAATTTAERLRALLEAEPARLSDLAAGSTAEAAAARSSTPAQLARALRGDLDNVLARALKREAADRYPTAEALAEDIRRHLNDEPVRARPDSLAYTFGKFVRRHRWGVAAAAGIAIALVAGVVGTTWQAYEAERQRALAVEQRDRAQGLLGRNDALVDFMGRMFTESLPPGQSKVIQEVLERGEAIAERDTSSAPAQRADILRLLATHYIALENGQKAERLQARARELVEAGNDPALKAELACTHAHTLWAINRRDEAMRLIEPLVADNTLAGTAAATCLQARAIMAQNSGDRAGALRYVETALERMRASDSPAPMQEASLLGDLGFAQFLAGRSEEAHRNFEEGLKRFRELGRHEGKQARRLMLDWGVVSYGTGNIRQGLALYEELIRLDRTMNASGGVPAVYLANYANGLQQAGRYAAALEAYADTEASAAQTGNVAARIYAVVGQAYTLAALGRLPEARRRIDEAGRTIAANKLPDLHPVSLRATLARAYIDAAAGDRETATHNLTAFIDLMTSKDASHAATGEALRQRAELALLRGDPQGARSDAERAIALGRKLQGSQRHSAHTGLSLAVLGRALQAAGADATATFRDADEHLSQTVDAGHPLAAVARRHARGS